MFKRFWDIFEPYQDGIKLFFSAKWDPPPSLPSVTGCDPATPLVNEIVIREDDCEVDVSSPCQDARFQRCSAESKTEVWMPVCFLWYKLSSTMCIPCNRNCSGCNRLERWWIWHLRVGSTSGTVGCNLEDDGICPSTAAVVAVSASAGSVHKSGSSGLFSPKCSTKGEYGGQRIGTGRAPLHTSQHCRRLSTNLMTSLAAFTHARAIQSWPVLTKNVRCRNRGIWSHLYRWQIVCH